MKPAKAILAILATFGATAASATQVVHLTGSTAYRGPTSQAIMMSFDGGQNVTVAAIKTGALSGGNQAFYHGLIGTVDTIIETDWTGSVGGVDALVNNASLNFFPDNTDSGGTDAFNGAAYVTQTVSIPSGGLTLANSDPSITTANVHGTGSSISAVYAGYYTVNNAKAEMAMSDTFQASTLYTSVTLGKATITNLAGHAVTDGIVGVVPFTWVKAPCLDTAAVNITNVSSQQINILYGAGQVPAMLFTGTTANNDANVNVSAFGRDQESGTRLTAFAESGLGANSAVIQYIPTASDASHITAVGVYPTVVLPDLGVTASGGNGGEASGGNLAGYVYKQFATGQGTAITYLGTSDATKAIKGTNDGVTGALPLSYNGFTILPGVAAGAQSFSYNFQPIQTGQYTFWGFEHAYVSPSINPGASSVANKIASNIYNYTAQIARTSMLVTRPIDGGQVTD